MWFKYKFKDSATPEIRQKTYKLWEKLIAYHKGIGATGPTLLNLTILITDDGWESWESFADAAAFERHVTNTKKCPLGPEVNES